MSSFYWDEGRMRLDGAMPSILAIGDSWFWYPLPGGSLLETLGTLAAPRGHVIFALGNNGAEVYDYVDGKYRKLVRNALQRYGDGLSAVFISGGGNDFAGFADVRPMLKPDCSGATQPSDCFIAGTADHTLGWLMKRVTENYNRLIGQVLMSSNPGVLIVLHNYDNALPSGKPVFPGGQAWFKPAFDDAHVPAGLQQGCLLHVLDKFTAVVDGLASASLGQITVVHSRGTLTASDWANELHPTAAGFAKIANQAWRPVLANLGLA